MKTLKNITLFIITLITISSCTTEEYYTSNEEWYYEEFEIQENHWQLVGDPDKIGSYYKYDFGKLPLNISYYEGVVTAYIFFNYDSKDEIQTPLPYTEYIIDIDPNTNEEIKYSIQYSYDVKANDNITFKAHVSDYYTSLFNPGTQYFRVAVVWPK